MKAHAPAVPSTERPTIWLCEPGWEATLADELRRTCPTDVDRRDVGRGWVAWDDDAIDAESVVAFSRQCMQRAVRCEAESIGRWSAAVCAEIVARLDAVDAPWRLHVFGLPQSDGSSLARRAALVAERIDADLRESRRRLAKRRSAESEGPWLADEALVQVAFETPTAGFVGVCSADELDDAPARLLPPSLGPWLDGELALAPLAHDEPRGPTWTHATVLAWHLRADQWQPVPVKLPQLDRDGLWGCEPVEPWALRCAFHGHDLVAGVVEVTLPLRDGQYAPPRQ